MSSVSSALFLVAGAFYLLQAVFLAVFFLAIRAYPPANGRKVTCQLWPFYYAVTCTFVGALLR